MDVFETLRAGYMECPVANAREGLFYRISIFCWSVQTAIFTLFQPLCSVFCSVSQVDLTTLPSGDERWQAG